MFIFISIYQDIDDYFQKMRDWVNNYTTLMRETSNVSFIFLCLFFFCTNNTQLLKDDPTAT